MEHGLEAAVEEREQLALGLVHQLLLLDLLLVLQPMTTDLLATGEKCIVNKSWWLVKFRYFPFLVVFHVFSCSCHFKS